MKGVEPVTLPSLSITHCSLLLLPVAQSALRQITDKAREFGADALFNQILPLLMSPTLEDQERHLLVKVIDRILYKLDDLVRPYVHKVSGWGIRNRGYPYMLVQRVLKCSAK